MTDPVLTNESQKKSEKKIRKEIQGKLAGALSDYKSILGDKKFENHLKKTSKLLSEDLTKASRRKKQKTVKLPPKKENKQKTS